MTTTTTTTIHSLKVGIDFGTTYSGIAWAHTATPDKINVIQKWPAGGNRNCEKVPTEIIYNADGTHKWGFELPLEVEKLRWIKLLLDPSKYTSSNTGDHSPLARTKKLMPSSKTAVDVVADYLRSLKNHALDTLGRNFGQEFMEVTPVDWILTVPAIWSDAAKASTMQAAVTAGLKTCRHTIQLISEPDAAAVCTLHDIHPNHLKVGDTFVVVDCGGGTVDLISYQIVALHPRLEVKECAVGTGGICGSTFVDINFEKLVRLRIGSKFDKMKPKGRHVMIKYFEESLKRTFCNDEDEDMFSCPIPGVADNLKEGVEDGFFVLTREDMLEIFEPVIAKIVGLVQLQIDAVEANFADEEEWDECTDYYFEERKKLNVSTILLVGGFGSSEYLRKRLISGLKVKGDTPIQIMQPTSAWSAIARGAVLRGLEGGTIRSCLEGGTVRSRLARRNYGVECTIPYNPSMHYMSEILPSQWDGLAEVPYCAIWLISKSDEISENNPIPCSFHSRWRVDWTQDIILCNRLLASDLIRAPKRSNTGDSYMLCELISDLRDVPRDTFPIQTSPYGYDYYNIDYNLIMTVQSAMLLFEFEFEGKAYGSVTAKYY